jgi:diphthamide synthase subunit DPH2
MYAFNEEFNLNEFIKKIKKYNKQQTIISVLPEDFDKEKMDIVRKLKAEGIEFCADNVED